MKKTLINWLCLLGIIALLFAEYGCIVINKSYYPVTKHDTVYVTNPTLPTLPYWRYSDPIPNISIENMKPGGWSFKFKNDTTGVDTTSIFEGNLLWPLDSTSIIQGKEGHLWIYDFNGEKTLPDRTVLLLDSVRKPIPKTKTKKQ